ncbi:MAG: glycoside hydrolase family 13 protein, partial [Oscillospiraceae bacterium]|nr:glycoside hydrolase family 13 protein [Oscillospiraceae bacterium]
MTPAQTCTLHLHVPTAVEATQVAIVLKTEAGVIYAREPMELERSDGVYDIFTGSFRLDECGLYFYYFDVVTRYTGFPLYKQGDGTNMCEGDLWQVSCVPADYHVPADARGAVIYQIFPDRFFKSGDCDCTGKLEPYWVHSDWYEQPEYLPDRTGEILNNDFFGGNLRGVIEKLPEIQALGAEYLYLNPIFMAYSNHRYDTCDYKRVDPMLGTEADFAALCEAAHSLGMKVILDGVFSHTGSDSVYFDANGRYGNGAVTGESSPYYSWYDFYHFPDRYNCWWGIRTLPCVNKLDPGYMDYIIRDEDSVIAHWLRLGADGFRLDVVDELPEPFLRALRKRLREINPDALLIGEVWEDASNKIAYEVRRTYFTGAELDSVMNYPWRTAILRYCLGADDGWGLRNDILTLAENYPPQVLSCVMNSLSTHDTARALTALADPFHGTRAEKAERSLSPEARRLGLQRLRMAMALQFVLQLVLGLRQMGVAQAVMLNLFMFVPATWLLNLGVLYLQHKGQ